MLFILAAGLDYRHLTEVVLRAEIGWGKGGVGVGVSGDAMAGGNHSYLRFRLNLLIWGLLLRLENVINQLSDPAKGKPPVQISTQLDRRTQLTQI